MECTHTTLCQTKLTIPLKDVHIVENDQKQVKVNF